MSTSLILMIVCFLALMVIGLPIAYNLLITTVVYLLSADLNIVQLAIKMYGGMNSFSFLAVPFFVLTGQLMLRGGLLESLVKFVNVWFGNFKGAIAIVTIGASLLMGSIVGLAVASAASLGVFLIPMMKKEGYAPGYAAAVMSSASLLGPIMPPSVLMILYCTAVGNTSIAGLFMAAVIPACMIALAQCIIAHTIAKKRGYPSYGKSTWKEKGQATLRALPALFLPVIILGGIFSGIFSITEASGVAVVYSAIIAFFVNRSVKLKDIPQMIVEAASTSGLVLILAGAGTAMAWGIANERVMSLLIEPLSAMPQWQFLLLVNILLIICGMFIDFGVNCILNNAMELAAVFTGSLVECHSAAVEYVRKYLGVGFEKPDVIVTCPGQPLDIDFYQSVKALIGMTEILDGDIVTLLTCGCAEGVNSPDMLRAFASGSSLAEIERFTIDNYEIQMDHVLLLAKIFRKGARVVLSCPNVTDDEARTMLMEPVSRPQAALERAMELCGKPEPKVLFYPRPQTGLPYLK